MTLQEQALEIMDEATDLVEQIDNGNYVLILEGFTRLADKTAALAPELAQGALNAGMTKKAIAEKLDVPTNWLRGLVKS